MQHCPRESTRATRRSQLPPLEEQRRIAEILDTIDETIQATERVIAKLEQLEHGLVDESYRVLGRAPMTPSASLAIESH